MIPHNRESLVSNAVLSVTGSAGVALGVFNTAPYAKFAGLISLIGSGTFTYAMGIDSGTLLVTSSFLVNSTAGVTFDVANFGHAASFSFSQLSSQTTAKILLYGETNR